MCSKQDALCDLKVVYVAIKNQYKCTKRVNGYLHNSIGLESPYVWACVSWILQKISSVNWDSGEIAFGKLMPTWIHRAPLKLVTCITSRDDFPNAATTGFSRLMYFVLRNSAPLKMLPVLEKTDFKILLRSPAAPTLDEAAVLVLSTEALSSRATVVGVATTTGMKLPELWMP